MEKQIVFRSVGQNLPFLMVLAGSIEDGQFKPESGGLRRILDACRIDSMWFEYPNFFQREPVIARSDFYSFLLDAFNSSCLTGVDYFDNFVVFKFNCYEVEEEATKEE